MYISILKGGNNKLKIHLKVLQTILIVLIILSLFFNSSSAAAQNSNAGYKDQELARAVSLGLGAYAKNAPITYKQFFKMLDSVVEKTNAAVLPQWKKKLSTARASNKTMRRDEGMLAVFYTADTLGTEYNDTNSDWDERNKKIGESAWSDMSWNYPLFPDWKQPAKLVSQKWDNHMVPAYFYAMGRLSNFTGKSIFDFDPVSVSMRPSKTFTYEEGLRAAVRLYDSGIHKRIPSQEDKAILARAEARREAILHSKTNVSVKVHHIIFPTWETTATTVGLPALRGRLWTR